MACATIYRSLQKYKRTPFSRDTSAFFSLGKPASSLRVLSFGAPPPPGYKVERRRRGSIENLNVVRLCCKNKYTQCLSTLYPARGAAGGAQNFERVKEESWRPPDKGRRARPKDKMCAYFASTGMNDSYNSTVPWPCNTMVIHENDFVGHGPAVMPWEVHGGAWRPGVPYARRAEALRPQG